ncbi:hypothetical protein [Paraliomyxa miuraensis]|uniref:hypothetical protein n=1 Tax=Paraliomyxa miuraensis TaxID=376150 RepID=UPI00225AA823|nr:hypothetical protein [Paraliomyxa miuraensis]MCX4239470.1 hypothetical protein [Paraliomyxa miuraensis]
MSAIRWERALPPALVFHVLAHLPLGRDAASLFDETLPRRAWVNELLEAYAAAPGRLWVHALGLRHREGMEALREAPPPGLRDEAGQRLLRCLLDAMASEREGLLQAWQASAVEADARRAEVITRIAEPLTMLRRALWEQQGEPPPLLVLDCPALGLAGRGASDARGRVVAVSLAAPVEHLLCQIVHEEIHPVTDPIVRESSRITTQDTRAGTPGHALHGALEHAAIEVGEALIEARAPQWSGAYARWRGRFG